MVTQFGMSKKLGPLTFGDKDELIFLGRQISEQRNYSEEVAEQIDFEVRQLVDEAHNRALQLLRDNIDKLKLIADRLMEEETIDAEQFLAMFAAGTLESGNIPPQGTPSKDKDAPDSPPRMVPPSTAPQPV
jgi:cell division protease FtsH